MKTITGDLIAEALSGRFDVIIHGCNCMCRMNRGIALQIKETFPEAFAADQATVCGDVSKLGSISTADITRAGEVITVVNGYTQFDFEGEFPLVDYEAVRSVMKLVGDQFADKRIGYPKLGAGLAGGEWETISAIIDEELEGLDHTLVVFER